MLLCFATQRKGVVMAMKFLEVIKFEGDNGTLIWKHPAEDFNTSSTLIVHESQEAIFFKNGQIADTFTAGRYVLKTENIPLLRKIMNIPTGGESTFYCEVYFVNKVEKMALKWGTDSKVEFIEPNYNFPMAIGASGEMSIKISNAPEFLVRLVGTETLLTADGLVRYFRALLMNRVKSHLARTIKEQQLNIFEIDTQLDTLSDAIKQRLIPDFKEYGIDLIQFFISNVVRPDDDPAYRRLKEATAKRYTDIFDEETRQRINLMRGQTEAQMRIIEAQSLAEKRRLEGYTYRDERGFDVAEKIASNEETGQFTNMGIGMGVMTGVGTVMGGALSNSLEDAIKCPESNINSQKENTPAEAEKNTCSCGAFVPEGAQFCPQCGARQERKCNQCGAKIIPGAKFCLECGAKL